jgi:hypothetical protein
VLLVKSDVPCTVSDVHASTSLVRAYALLDRVGYARKVFNRITERSVVSWNVLLDALVNMGGPTMIPGYSQEYPTFFTNFSVYI